MIEDLAVHPSCSRFITHKLCRHFICDYPTEQMIAPIVQAWEASDGHLPTVHEALLEVAYEYTGKIDKFQNPEVWLVQMANMADLHWPLLSKEMKYDFNIKPPSYMRRVKGALEEIGLVPYRPIQPNGWSDLGADWISPELLLRRIVFAKKYSVTKTGDYRPQNKDSGPRDWKPIHMLNSNFDSLDEVLQYLSLDKNIWQENPKDKKLFIHKKIPETKLNCPIKHKEIIFVRSKFVVL